MSKIVLVFITSVFFLGCSNFQITGIMCDQVRMDPLATVPSECRRYVESEAEKASKVHKEILSPDDAIKFTKEK